jgi:MarR family transcriptional regulator for hemolysin
LLDRLSDNGLIERRADPDDRRAKRLYLTPAARPLLEQLTDLGEDLMATALAGLGQGEIAALLAHLSIVKENLRQALQKKQPILEKQYG